MSDRYVSISLLDLGGIGIVDTGDRKLIARCDRPEHARLIAGALNDLACADGHEPGVVIDAGDVWEARRCSRCGVEFVLNDDGTQAEVQ